MKRRFFYSSFILLLLAAGLKTFAQPATDAFSAYAQQLPGTELKFNMVPIKGGAFTMGSNAGEKNRKADEGPAREITVSSFWMGATEVTYDEYDAFFKDESVTRNQPAPDAVTRPSPPYIDLTLGMGKQGGFPANSMSQYGALMYCKWLYKKTGIFYRLPTEAEWEYACRAGSKTAYPFANDTAGLSKYAWYKNNSENKYHKTGLKQPNQWGLYDMMGNVAEWTLDQYDENYFKKEETGAKDPLIKPATRHPRTLKGGNFSDDAASLRSASRLPSTPDWNRRDPQIPRSRWWNADAPFIGFRLARPAVKPSEEEINQFFSTYLDKY
ncbi:MAG: SUMF1/EgtB/PvdO family nonheme iron enzyme [Williamsia sp.]|nr:SUMF1/EgtB/PvdO family nonheme iron enzyme [Williamsia sp.]